MKKPALIIIILIAFSCSSTTNSNHSSINSKRVYVGYKKKNFDSLLIANKTLHLDFYGELLVDSAFVNIMEHDSLYLDDATTFLTTKPFTQDQVALTICAMQDLNLDDYVKFCRLLMNLYDQNKIINFNLIEYAIWSPPHFLEHRRKIIDNYNNQRVINLLVTIQDDKRTPTEFKRYINDDILSGKAKKDLEAFE